MVCLIVEDVGKHVPLIKLDEMTFRNPDKFPEDIDKAIERSKLLRSQGINAQPIIIIGFPHEANKDKYIQGSNWKK